MEIKNIDLLEAFEVTLTELDDTDQYANRRVIVDDAATLAERIGPEAARQWTRENSLTYATRIGVAKRLGRRAVL